MNARSISALVNSGADSFLNMYDIFIKFPWEDAEQVMVRAKGFTIPEASVDGYDIEYHGNSIKRPSTKVSFERGFSLTFRSDAAYSLYGMFIAWQQAVVDPVNGGVSNWPSAIGSIKVRALGGTYTAAESAKTLVGSAGEIASSSTNPVWTFNDVWVSKVAQPSFANDSTSIFEFEVQFYFADTDYPFYNGAGINGTDTSNN